MERLALITIILPFVGAFIVGLNKQSFPKIATIFAALATLGTLAVAGQWYANGAQSVTYDLVKFGDTAIFGVTLDAVSTLIAFAVVGLGFLICLYSCGYLTDKNREHPHNGLPRFYAFLLIFIGAMAGLVYSSTLAGQLLFFEITGGCSWALISYYQSQKAMAAAMKALIITHVGSLGLYLAAAYLFSQSGTFSITALEHLAPEAKTIVLFGVMFAAWGKSAQLPMQIWLPNAMEAPTPVSAYLHAASMVKVGVYIFARSVMSAGEIPHVVGEVGIVMAMITLIYGFLMYLPQADLKRLLAYSTITQLSYIFIGLSLAALGSKLAFVAAIAYIFNHAFAKSLFFLVAGSLSYATGTRSMPRLQGIMRTMPVVGTGFGIAALAIAGVPPFNGFFSKFPLFAAWGKSAQLPMQIWLPNAMEAPTPVSAYLHAASMVKVGVYIFARSVMSAGEIPHIVGEVGIVMAMITLIYGFLMYLPQADLKRLLAYSTITQLSYIFIGLSLAALGSKLAFVAAIAYIFNHAFAKSLFFLVAGSLSYATGTRSMPRLQGIMRTMPVVGTGFGIAALAIAGVPPFNGFFSKFPLFAAGFDLGQEYSWVTWLMVIALIESTATFVWLLYKFGQCVIGKPSEDVQNAQPLPFSMTFVLVILMVMSVCSSFIAAYWLGLAG